LATPGLIAIRSAPANVSVVKAPLATGTSGNSAASFSAYGGLARVSATRTDAPFAAR